MKGKEERREERKEGREGGREGLNLGFAPLLLDLCDLPMTITTTTRAAGKRGKEKEGTKSHTKR